MKALNVVVNGQQICLAGLTEAGFVGAHVNILNAPESPLSLNITGMQDNTTLHWCEFPLEIGSEVSIRVVDADTADAPTAIQIPKMSMLQRFRFCWDMFFFMR